MINNTLAGNTAPVGSAIFADGFDVDTLLANNAIIGEGFGTVAIFCGDFNDVNSPRFVSNDVYSANGSAFGGVCEDETGSNGNISLPPLFASAGSGDYAPRSGSPLIDAASSSHAPNLDIDGHPRPLDGDGDGIPTPDIGAFEIGEASISASVGGFSAVWVVCANLTTRERKVLRNPDGFRDIDCRDVGLTVREGDRVRINIYGRVRE